MVELFVGRISLKLGVLGTSRISTWEVQRDARHFAPEGRDVYRLTAPHSSGAPEERNVAFLLLMIARAAHFAPDGARFSRLLIAINIFAPPEQERISELHFNLNLPLELAPTSNWSHFFSSATRYFSFSFSR